MTPDRYRPTRRRFVQGAAAATTAAWAGTKPSASEDARQPSANEQIHLGLIGCGGRGRDVMREFQQLPAARIVAVCDLHARRMEEARQEAGGQKVRAYPDYRQLLESNDVDAVIVATNGHWHVLPTIHACQAGKDVYVEKPLGTSIGEGRAAVRAARKYDCVVQIGTQQRSWEHYAKAVEIIQSGRLGEISEVKVWDYENQYPGFGSPPDSSPPPELDWDFWVGPSPEKPYNQNRFLHHYWYFDYGGGWQLDWAVHHYDIVHWAMGVKWPIAATALGRKMCFADSREWPDTFSGVLEYGPGPVAKRGFLLQYTFRGGCRREHRSHGKLFCGTEGSMLLDRGGYTITSEDRGGKLIKEESYRGRGPNHAEVFLRHVRDRTLPLADVQEGHYSSNPGHLLNIAWRVGQRISWDGQKEQVIDDPAANCLVTKQYRAPWTCEV